MNEDINLGYEIEMVVPNTVSRDTMKKKLESFGFPTIIGYNGKYNVWKIASDCTINAPRSTSYGVELISPVMSYEEGIKNLKTVFDWMIEVGCSTNRSTGFHVNLSFKDADLMKSINPEYLTDVVKEQKILNQFDRSRNGYCNKKLSSLYNKTNSNYFKSTISNMVDYSLEYDRLINKTDIRQMAKNVTGKNCFTNLSKLSRGWIEFRGMGGHSYHTRYDEIVPNINHLIESMRYAAIERPMDDAVLTYNVQKVLEYRKEQMQRFSINQERNHLSQVTRLRKKRAELDKLDVNKLFA